MVLFQMILIISHIYRSDESQKYGTHYILLTNTTGAKILTIKLLNMLSALALKLSTEMEL
jgi:hypothetical protein